MEIQCSIQISQSIHVIPYLLAGYVRGLDHLWVFGDDFAQQTANSHFMAMTEDESYARRNFEISVYTTNLFLSNERNMLTRHRNLLVTALRDHKPLPKMIIVVLEDDFIRNFKYKATISTYTRALKWIMREYKKLIDIYKDFLPRKAQKLHYPHFIWVKPVKKCQLP